MDVENRKSKLISSVDIEIGRSLESLTKALESQRELFTYQIEQLNKIVVTQCKLTGANPLSQEMAAGALSIKIGKRPRDLLNPKAIKYMQSVFSIKDAISKKETRDISSICGVTATQVKDFFASQRSRVRKFLRLSQEKVTRSIESRELEGSFAKCENDTSDSNPIPVDLLECKPVQDPPSCSSQKETIPGIDSSDISFLENICNLMRKEETFSGQVKLLEWILQIDNSTILHGFVTKGGVTLLANWLNQSALEEQTTVLLSIFKVLCHLPLHKVFPLEMSTILQIVNRLRFYRTTDISNRARILLSRWSKLLLRSQALRKPSSEKSSTDLQKEIIRKQRISEILSDGSWQSKVEIPADFLALTAPLENCRKMEPSHGAKLLLPSSEESNKKHSQSISSSQTKIRRKVLLVEHPNHKTTGRNVIVSRVGMTNKARPISADDIQKAKMRSIFMQKKYGKRNSASNESQLQKTECSNQSPSFQSNITSSNVETVESKECDKISLTSISNNNTPLTVSHPPNPISPQESSWDNLRKDQIPWQLPAEMSINSLWTVGAGEKSKEFDIQTERTYREKEIVYLTTREIPPNPKEPWDIEMDYDDTLTLEIPTEQSPDIEEIEASSTQHSIEAPFTLPTSAAIQTPGIVSSPFTILESPLAVSTFMSIQSPVNVSPSITNQASAVLPPPITNQAPVLVLPSNTNQVAVVVPPVTNQAPVVVPPSVTNQAPVVVPPSVTNQAPVVVPTPCATIQPLETPLPSPASIQIPLNVPTPTAVQISANNGKLEPDLELLAVLLKNPDLVFALTSGQYGNLTSTDTVALLDFIKASGMGLPGILNGLNLVTAEKPKTEEPKAISVLSLSSPTPVSETTTQVSLKSDLAPVTQSMNNPHTHVPISVNRETSKLLPTMAALPQFVAPVPEKMPLINSVSLQIPQLHETTLLSSLNLSQLVPETQFQAASQPSLHLPLLFDPLLQPHNMEPRLPSKHPSLQYCPREAISSTPNFPNKNHNQSTTSSQRRQNLPLPPLLPTPTRPQNTQPTIVPRTDLSHSPFLPTWLPPPITGDAQRSEIETSSSRLNGTRFSVHRPHNANRNNKNLLLDSDARVHRHVDEPEYEMWSPERSEEHHSNRILSSTRRESDYRRDSRRNYVSQRSDSLNSSRWNYSPSRRRR